MPEAPTAPAAPAAAPVTAPKPAPAAKPSTAPPPAAKAPPAPPATGQKPPTALDKTGEDYDAQFDKVFGEKEKPLADPAKDRDAKAPDVAKDAPAATPDPKLKTQDDPALKGMPPQFRAKYDETVAKLAAANLTIPQLEAKIKEGEKAGESVKALTERLDAREAEIKEMNGKLRALKQETDPEFQEKWDKPFLRQQAYARQQIAQLEVMKDDGTTRPAVWEDFTALYKLPVSKAIEQAKALFGDAAYIATGQLDKLQELDWQREEALKEVKAGWETSRKEEAAKEAQARVHQEEQRKQYQEARAKAIESYANDKPDQFGEDPNDEDGNAILNKSREFFAAVPQTAQEMVAYQAALFHKASAFDRQTHRLERVRGELKEALATIEEMKNSDPGKTRRDSAAPDPATETWEQEARRTASV